MEQDFQEKQDWTLYMYGHYRDGILWNRIFCGKAKLDPVHVCFYGDG